MSRKNELKMIWETKKRFKNIREHDLGDNPLFTEEIDGAIKRVTDKIDAELDRTLGKPSSKLDNVQTCKPVKT